MQYQLKQIIKEFSDVAESFVELATFGYGFDFDINSQPQSQSYMCQLWIQPLTSQAIFGRGTSAVSRRFRIYCYDLVRQDEKNQISVYNQTEGILLDYIRYFSYNSGKQYQIVNSPLLVPFKESFADDVSGYYAEIEIKTPDVSGFCFLPVK
jgi:hypothetical protein